MPGVQVPPLGPNKVDNFDTIGIETINLILLPIILAGQGFSAFSIFGLVSLWVFSGVFSRFWTPIFCLSDIHTETIPRRKVSVW